MSQRTGKIFKLEFNNVPYKIGLQKKDGQKHFGGGKDQNLCREILTCTGRAMLACLCCKYGAAPIPTGDKGMVFPLP